MKHSIEITVPLELYSDVVSKLKFKDYDVLEPNTDEFDFDNWEYYPMFATSAGHAVAMQHEIEKFDDITAAFLKNAYGILAINKHRNMLEIETKIPVTPVFVSADKVLPLSQVPDSSIRILLALEINDKLYSTAKSLMTNDLAFDILYPHFTHFIKL